jgi:hypothetical protein
MVAHRNLVSDIKGGIQTEGVWEQGAEEDIWSEERRGDGRMVKNNEELNQVEEDEMG